MVSIMLWITLIYRMACTLGQINLFQLAWLNVCGRKLEHQNNRHVNPKELNPAHIAILTSLTSLFFRFDLMGLSPDSPEDEAGIKRAAENSKWRFKKTEPIFSVLNVKPSEPVFQPVFVILWLLMLFLLESCDPKIKRKF